MDIAVRSGLAGVALCALAACGGGGGGGGGRPLNPGDPGGGTFSPGVGEEKVGTRTLPFIETVDPFNKKRIYAIVKRGYVIFIALKYADEKNLEAMKLILGEADLDWKKS